MQPKPYDLGRRHPKKPGEEHSPGEVLKIVSEQLVAAPDDQAQPLADWSIT